MTDQSNLIKELGLENLPEEKKLEVMLGVGRIIQQNVILRVLEELDERGKRDFDKFLAQNKGKEEEITKFLQQKIPHLEQIVNEEIEKFKKGSVDFMNSITK